MGSGGCSATGRAGFDKPKNVLDVIFDLPELLRITCWEGFPMGVFQQDLAAPHCAKKACTTSTINTGVCVTGSSKYSGAGSGYSIGSFEPSGIGSRSISFSGFSPKNSSRAC